jgi:flagellin
MAVNDISLTAAMRSNLLALQQTADLMARTQTRLSSGKKVNSAMDNPTSFFAAQALNSRASILDGLKDAMGQATSTIEAASKGITAITSLIEQAKGIATQAQSASITYDAVDLTLSGIVAADTVTVDGTTLTAGTDFAVGANDSETAKNLAVAINNNATLNAAGDSAKVVGAKVIVTNSGKDLATADVVASAHGTTAAGTLGVNGVDSFKNQFNNVISQLNALALDSGYQGKNLLNGDSLDVKFEGTNLTVNGFKATSGGALAIDAATWTAQSDSATQVDQLDAALVTLRAQSSALSANLSIITARSDFTTDIGNTLKDGANKLVLADTNEEGANMLMLQTRQSLSTTSLSLAAQSAQAVLKLFQ